MNKQDYRDKLIATLKRAINDENVFPEFSYQVNDYMANFCTEYGRIKPDEFIIEIRSLYVDVSQDNKTAKLESEREKRNGVVKLLENMALVEDL